jgi:hypothetical protein
MILKSIYDFIRRFTHSREWCHEEMQKRGSVGPNGCPGLVGGDYETDFLQYECIGCPYIDPKAYCMHPVSSK